MKDRIYIATFSEKAVEVAGKYGLKLELNDLCISENLDADRLESTLSRMKEQLAASGSDMAIIHGPFTEIIPASIDHRAVELGLARLEEAYQACFRMGLNRMVVHTGYPPALYFKEWNHEKSVWFWKKYMENKPAEFHIYIENVFEDEPVMLKHLVEEIADPRVKLCLDVGHANAVTCDGYDITDWIRVLGTHIGHFHLHNNDGTEDSHSPVCQGTMDMKKVMEAIEEYCCSDVTMTIESRTCEDSAEWLLRYLG